MTQIRLDFPYDEDEIGQALEELDSSSAALELAEESLLSVKTRVKSCTSERDEAVKKLRRLVREGQERRREARIRQDAEDAAGPTAYQPGDDAPETPEQDDEPEPPYDGPTGEIFELPGLAANPADNEELIRLVIILSSGGASVHAVAAETGLPVQTVVSILESSADRDETTGDPIPARDPRGRPALPSHIVDAEYCEAATA